MSATCDPVAERITGDLGFSCHDVNPVVTLRNPAELANWTLPVLELLIIAGAIFALVHAIRRLRRDGDPANLALWFASLVYLFVIEPPLYFPEWFGLQEEVGFFFAHNVFTVQFMYDRLPLYIIAIYPALSQLAYELVRTLGVFQRKRGALIGAVCVAFVCQVFYEIFDQLGPQLKWWAWNLDNDLNQPLLASVPLNSVMLFASVSFGTLTYLIVKLVEQPNRRRRLGAFALLWRVLVAGALVPISMSIAGIPASIFGGETPNRTAQGIVLALEIAALWIAGAILLYRQWRRGSAEALTPYVRIYPVVYLVVFAVLWAAALPEFLDATDGRTPGGTYIGNAPYTAACFVVALACLAAVYFRRASTERPEKVPAGSTV
ncbi:hypothetical protein [Nocardia sp. NPDC051832]|uniref:hypothetical protein n=1 Tax=Nocardia sp. NPDC051832 TaxID=3155673 RepID=UPI00344173F3